jgi:hypothetical protein
LSPAATTGALVSRSGPHARKHPRASRAFVLALLLHIALPGWALATPVQGPCRGTECEAFELLERRTVRTGSDGTLIWVRTLAWTSAGPERLHQADESGHVFCSTTRPALIITEKGSTSAVMLAPLSEWEYDQRPGVYARYFETCHSAGAEVARGRSALARHRVSGLTRERLAGAGLEQAREHLLLPVRDPPGSALRSGPACRPDQPGSQTSR